MNENMTNKEILDTVDDIVRHGCASGMVPALIYYSDTEPFFDRHADEIFDIYNNGIYDFELSKKSQICKNKQLN